MRKSKTYEAHGGNLMGVYLQLGVWLQGSMIDEFQLCIGARCNK